MPYYPRDNFWSASPTFPGSPVEGDLFYETDTDKLWVYDGANWVQQIASGAWDSYTPTNTAITLGNGVQTARWTLMARTIHVNYELTFGSTTAFTADVSIGLPVASATAGNYPGVATYPTGASSNIRRLGSVRRNGSLLTQLNHANPAGNLGVVNPTNPDTWQTGNVVWVSLTYEAAASTQE